MVLAFFSAARADFNASPADNAMPDAASSASFLPIGSAAPDSLDQSFASSDLTQSFSTEATPDSPSSDLADPRVVRRLPAAPSSLTLFLSAILSVGAYQVVKQAKYVHLSAVPEWYHADAPAQVGHAVLFDLQFAPLAASVFDQPTCKPASVVRAVLRDFHLALNSQQYVILPAPRGPPLRA